MFEVEFYEDKNGSQPVKEVLLELRNKARSVPKNTDVSTSFGNIWDADWRATDKTS